MATVILLGRAVCFCTSFQIKVKGRPTTAEEAPILIVGPHSSFFDGLVLFYCSTLPSCVSRLENSSILIVGSLIEYTQPVLVKREDPNSRTNTIKEIHKRAHSGGKWPQIIIFPEGTCTNRSCLINFKSGAFYPGTPVQPVIIRYPNQFDTVTWTWEGPGAFALLWYTLCQFYTSVEIEFLPVYTPSEEEKKNAALFASNVRAKMAEALGVPVTDHSYDDCRLMQKAAKLKLPKSAGLVEFMKLNKKLGLKFDHANDLLDKYYAIAKNSGGNITYDEFAKYLRLPKSEALEEVFNLYDRNGSGTIDFREYVIGLSLISSPENTEETIKFAFQLFDEGNKGYITKEELSTILHGAFNMDGLDAKVLFDEVDVNEDGKICFDEFYQHAMKKPEYAKLFKTYQNAKMNGHEKQE
nr:lysophosphatidylcholine acyltransferase 2-like isoform X3 [Crassostrea virginica]XP_022344071.1 lysophosphatidylcholine acyltransferase 2-like isoform X3 [Crassostrea virginica]XP_022344072.1 lysophosphatidylcholine acyltransferase 2-like isoform X3 [Crassostrea virginica]XP_022344073.1 lysophosphatidylcholine acyltransferase 2-like isoform X3 [Crassostrea virginica]XP_022344075.1 lysophosphatidylcholine acyltransferase 2-like isoform X3 [Crassostrea virginica]